MVANSPINFWDYLGLDPSSPSGVNVSPSKGLSIGEKISAKYTNRWLVGMFNKPKDTLTLTDDLNEMGVDLKSEFDEFYLEIFKQNMVPKDYTWRKWTFTAENASRYKTDPTRSSLIWPSRGFMTAGWWLSESKFVVASGEFEFKCAPNGLTKIRKRKVEWQWKDIIDANEYKDLVERKEAALPWAILEGGVIKPVEDAIDADFDIIIKGKDDRLQVYPFSSKDD